VNSSDDNFIQPSDEDAQDKILTEEELTSIRMSDTHRTPNKEDGKPAAQPETKIVLHRLSQIEEDSINENMKQIT
jgi:hypothetical protein